MGSITGLRFNSQASATGAGRYFVGRGDFVQHAARPGQIARRQRKPGNKADVVLLAIIQHILAFPVGQIVAVLHRGDGKDFSRRFDFLDRNFAEAGMRNHAVVQQGFDRGELLVARYARIDAVQLPKSDAFRRLSRSRLLCAASSDIPDCHWATSARVPGG